MPWRTPAGNACTTNATLAGSLCHGPAGAAWAADATKLTRSAYGSRVGHHGLPRVRRAPARRFAVRSGQAPSAAARTGHLAHTDQVVETMSVVFHGERFAGYRIIEL